MRDITLSHLNKAFDGKPVLRDFSAVFPAGKMTAVMGQSGIGKTTLLRILLGLEKKDSGSITGTEGVRFSVVFQEDRLLEALTPVGNIRLTAPRCLESEILRALLSDGEVLLLDEPFKGLDEETKGRVMDYTRRLAAGKTVILVTHDEREAKAMGAQILKL